jgi:hypothetical protein
MEIDKHPGFQIQVQSLPHSGVGQGYDDSKKVLLRRQSEFLIATVPFRNGVKAFE